MQLLQNKVVHFVNSSFSTIPALSVGCGVLARDWDVETCTPYGVFSKYLRFRLRLTLSIFPREIILTCRSILNGQEF